MKSSWDVLSDSVNNRNVALTMTYHIDILALVETWLSGDARDNRSLADLTLTLSTDRFFHIPWVNHAGGGVGVCVHKSFKVHETTIGNMESLECISILITARSQVPLTCLRLVIFYKPRE